jgi:putative oxidoreductase
MMHDSLYIRMARAGDAISAAALPLAARLVFAGVLLGYFWASAMTKFAGFPFTLSDGAFAQIYPRAFESLGYNSAGFGLWPRAVVLLGSYAEFILPAMIILGLLTRLAALGMIGFVAVQTATDIWGHGAGAGTIGAWFDRDAASLIADQRALWGLLLLILVLRGAGPFSLDRALLRRFGRL